MIICVVGTSGSGKTTSCEYIELEFGIPFVEVSNIIWEKYYNSSATGDVREYVKNQYKRTGKDIFALPAINQAEKLDTNIKIFCGFRTIEAINSVREFYDERSIFILGIHSNSNLKYQRIKDRDRHEGISYGVELQKELLEYRIGVAEIFEREVDKIIVNEGSINDFYKDVYQYIQSKLSRFDNAPQL